MIDNEFSRDFLMRLDRFGINTNYPNLKNTLNKHNEKSFLKINHYKNTLKVFNGEDYYRIISFLKIDNYLIDTHATINDTFMGLLNIENYDITMKTLKDNLYYVLDVIDKSLFEEGSTVILIQYNNHINFYNEYELVQMFSIYDIKEIS